MKEGDHITGKYRLLRRLAEGGMAEVWAVRNRRTNRDFAMKFLLPYHTNNSEAVERFVREARATGQLHHPNLVSVLDAGCTDEGRPYLVMELLSGESLERRLLRDRVLPELSVCVVLSQVARALAAAHRAGLVHRDLSSGNVFLVPADQGSEPVVKLLDFGVSKILGPPSEGRIRTATGAMLGSVEYMSPEQACGAEGVDARADLWSLGVLMYECLAGARPFQGSNYRAILYSILQCPHRPLREVAPRVDEELCALVDACLIKDRLERLDSAQDVARRLECIAWRLSARESERPRIVRRRATDRLSSTPRELNSARPSYTATGMPSQVLPLGVRCWQWFDRLGAARQIIALASAMGGAALGLVLGHIMADASRDPHAGLEHMQAPIVVGRTEGRVVRSQPIEVQSTEASQAPPCTEDSCVADESAPPVSLVQSVARGLEANRSEMPTRQGMAVASAIKPTAD